MEEQKKTETPAAAGNTRRTVLKTAAQVAVTAPAVGLLLSAATKPAAAQPSPYQATQQHILDDFTTGNTHEDIDGCKGFGLTQDDTPGGPGCAVGNTVGDI